jgi:aryl carrier-like protein
LNLGLDFVRLMACSKAKPSKLDLARLAAIAKVLGVRAD